MTKQIKLIVRVLLSLILVSGILLTKQAFALCGRGIHNCTGYHLEEALSAKEARHLIMQTLYLRHKKEIDLWLQYVNDEIVAQSKIPNASVSVDISKASIEVQNYLEMVYEQAGYYVDLILGWDKINNKPDGTTYLGLSW